MFRFKVHLGKGLYYGWFQLKSLKTGETHYIKPDVECIALFNCKLKNRKKTAQKIFDGASREVCAWIECEWFELVTKKQAVSVLTDDAVKISYNPKNAPFFCDQDGRDIDGTFFDRVVSIGKDVFSA